MSGEPYGTFSIHRHIWAQRLQYQLCIGNI